jgi:hypothetical protein
MTRTWPRCFSGSVSAPVSKRESKQCYATFPALLALILSLVTLNACSSMKVKLGMRIDLTQVPVSSMTVKLANGPAMAPGQKSGLIATLTKPDGTTLVTEGKGGGKVMWKDLQVAPQVVTANNKGTVQLSSDPRVSDGKTGSVVVTIPSQPNVKAADLDIPFRYNVAFAAKFAGASGMNGTDGMDGTDGTDGSMGSMDPNSPSPGGDGGNGTDGTNGSDGGPGGDGPAVNVSMTMQPGSATPLVQLYVASGKTQKYFLVDPNGGSLTVTSSGGSGGQGGRGGRGGRGGQGGTGTPDGSNGMSGSDGLAGQNGPDGRGGSITVACDPSAKQYLSVLKLMNPGGPKPSIDSVTVAPLW